MSIPCSSSGRGALSFGCGHLLHRRGGQAYGRRYLLSQHCSLGVDGAHVDQDTRHQAQSGVRTPVLPQRDHVVRTTGVVVVGIARQRILGVALVFREVDRQGPSPHNSAVLLVHGADRRTHLAHLSILRN